MINLIIPMALRVYVINGALHILQLTPNAAELFNLIHHNTIPHSLRTAENFVPWSSPTSLSFVHRTSKVSGLYTADLARGFGSKY
jgi:hypothetical protein